MARIRTIKPEMPGHPSLARVSRDARLLFVWLISDADDAGRVVAAPKRLAGVLYPLDADVTEDMVSGWLTELEASGLVQRYRHNGAFYLHLCSWTDHQLVSKPSPSRIPQPPDPGIPRESPGEFAETQESPGIPEKALADLGSRTVDLGPRTIPLAEISEKLEPASPLPAKAVPSPPSSSTKRNLAWESAHDAATAVWPDEPAATKAFAGLVAKGRDPDEAARAVRIAAVLIRAQGLRRLGALTNPARAALVARLNAVAAVGPRDSAEILAHWQRHAAAPGWPSEIGPRVQRLIDGWHTGPQTRPLPVSGSSAASRQADLAADARRRLKQTAHAIAELEIPA